jgi:hypothetical protein
VLGNWANAGAAPVGFAPGAILDHGPHDLRSGVLPVALSQNPASHGYLREMHVGTAEDSASRPTSPWR